MKKENEGKKANVPATEGYSFLRDFVYPIVQWTLHISIIISWFVHAATTFWAKYDYDFLNNHFLMNSLLGYIFLSAMLIFLCATIIAPNPPRLK